MFINQARETHIKVSTLLRTLQGHTKSDRGAAMVEYALLVALIAVVAIAAIAAFGSTLGQEFDQIDSNFADGVDNNPFANNN